MGMVLRTAERMPWWQELHPARPIVLLWQRRHLLRQLIRREVAGRYRGSLLGTLWTVLLPIFAVIVYTIVFGLIFQQKWPGMETNPWTYPFILWAGLAIFNAFAEVVQRATSVIAAQPNLVKKVVFPLDILPAMLVGTSLVPLGLSMLAVMVGITISRGHVPHIGWLLFAILCFLIWLQGVAWFLAGVGTFLRDLGPMVQAVCPLILFLSPIFYPVSVVPERFQAWFWCNPLAVVVETMRAALLHTALPPTQALIGLLLGSVITWQLGSLVFARLRPEMADVV